MNHQVTLRRTERVADFFMIVTAGPTLVPVTQIEDPIRNGSRMHNYLFLLYR